ncbi:MAG: hypothetical protein JO243_25300 [Solirubrobacterales bacterium]|nr:hypothetical protein [Solirubrobacterales bacterium]
MSIPVEMKRSSSNPVQGPGSTAHVEVTVVAVHLRDDTAELQLVPLALDTPATPVDGVVYPPGIVA